MESNFTVFKSEVETDFKTIVENIKSLITLEMFNDKTKQIENSFKLQVNNLSSRISELEVNKYNLEERVKQLEGKDKANNKRISKLENLVRNLSSQTNNDEVVSSSIETSNTEYQLDENITINIPTSNKFSPFQTMQDCSSTNTALPLENRLPLNSVPISCQGQIPNRSPDIYQTKPLMPRYREVRAQPHSENTSSTYSSITNSWSSLVPAHQETKSRTFPYQPMRQVNNSITETQELIGTYKSL